MMSRTAILVQMANDIADYFAAEPDHAQGVEGVLGHLQRFWDPRMRRKLAEHVRSTGGGDLSPLAREAALRLGKAAT